MMTALVMGARVVTARLSFVPSGRANNWPARLSFLHLGGAAVGDDTAGEGRSIQMHGGFTSTRPGADCCLDGEVALGIQVAAAAYSVATGKPAIIRVYWAGDIASAVRAAIHDGCDVCSISWGSDEAQWGKEAADYMEQTAAAAVAAGVVVFAASGDNDSSDGGSNPANVDTPASCPHVIACGGTRKTATSETV
jgi:hypothetical protein